LLVFFINAFFPVENKSSSSPYAVTPRCSIWRGRASFQRTYFYLFSLSRYRCYRTFFNRFQAGM